MRELNKNNGSNIYLFNKGASFVLLKQNDAIRKIDEQLEKPKIIDFDPAQRFTNKIHTKNIMSVTKKTPIYQ